MNLNNLLFFDKNGESYNLTLNSNGYWEGADYFLPVSTALYDCSNIFVLENTAPDVYKFPEMESGSKFEVKWVTSDAKDNFFLFTVQRENIHADSVIYLEKQDSITINHSDFGQSGTLDLSYPMQINVAFTPTQEIAYSRVLQVYYTTSTTSTLILEMTFYGEGEDEDERYRIWLENFGVKFNREDALFLKDYDLKEGLPDWQQINVARKNLLVNIDQVYPYVGTYKGLLNLLSLLGYRDVLRVREYWQDSDPNSLYYKKYATVDVTDLMKIGDAAQIDLVDANGQIKRGGKFKKTEFLALAYEFTVASDHYDEDGLPEVVSTTDFSVEEIFFKLHGISNKLKQEILPINVLVKDVIGEFIYFTKFNLRNWDDTTYVESSTINDSYLVKVLMPDAIVTDLKVRDLKTLYPKLNGTSEFPEISYNLGQIEPYQDQQKYASDEIDYLMDAITAFYADVNHYDYYHMGQTSPFDYGDDTLPKIGCPIILEAYIPDLQLQDLDGITFGDFILSEATTSSTLNTVGTGTKYFGCATIQSFRVGSRVKITATIDLSSYMEGTITEISPIGYPVNTIKVQVDTSSGATTSTGWTVNLVDTHFTIGMLRYKNGYEIEWIITGPQNYYFQWRDKVENVHKIPHILPHTGDYSIDLKVHDMHGGTSTAHKKITVVSEEPVLQAFVKIQDKTKYDFKSLSNITIGDLGENQLYRPFATVININGENAPISSIYSHYLDWFTYSEEYGVGSPQIDVQIYNPLAGFESYSVSTRPEKSRWGTGAANGQPIISDYAPATISDMKFVTFAEMGYVGDNIDGFYIDFHNLYLDSPSSYLTSMQFGGFTEIEFFMLIQTPQDLVDYLEAADLPGWREYRYQVIGDRVKATSKFQDKKNHSILKFVYTLSGVYNSTPYLPSSIDLDISSKEIKLGVCTLLQSEMIGPSGPFWLGPSGPWWYGPSGPWWENPSGLPYWVGPSGFWAGPSGYTPSGPSFWPPDTDLEFPNPSGPLWPGPSNWLFPTVYSNTILKLGDRLRIRNSSGGYAEGYVIGLSDYDIEVDVDLINAVGDFDEFDLAIVDTVYTFEKPVHVFDRLTMLDIQTTLSNAGLVLDEDLLFLNCPFPDQLISTRLHKGAAGSDIRYWINAGYVIYDNVLGEQTGNLPSAYDENSFNMVNVRATYNTMVVPIYHPMFVIISNLASNVETEWTLYSGTTVVAKVKTTSYFIWRFDTPGLYKLEVKSTDTRGNVYTVTTDIAVASAMEVNEYQKYVEKQLDARKFEMTHH